MPHIENKYQLIDDESQFQISELQGLLKNKVKKVGKQYHVISVIGSQSSGKSTLLNTVFKTNFQVLNRKKRIGQTTKGIWYAFDAPSSILILDIEGSDSNQRQERTKIQRRNSLFALAISHTLLINMWIQQIGLYKGSQLAIVQIILALNIKLFGMERPKQIIFVVRDFVPGEEKIEVLRQKLIQKVREVWENIVKPQKKKDVKLEDLFQLNAFFLPSKIDEEKDFQQQCHKFYQSLSTNTKNKQIIRDNVPMIDFPKYIQNIWNIIVADKDVNLPQQKILLSNLRCHKIKNQVYELFSLQFINEIQRSERKINLSLKSNMKDLVQKMIQKYNQLTINYIETEIVKVRTQFINQLDLKIQLVFTNQIKFISDQCLKSFSDEVNRTFIKDKNIRDISKLKPQFINKFESMLVSVCYKPEWKGKELQKFQQLISKHYEHQKEKIIQDSLKDLDLNMTEKIENAISNGFYDRNIFCQRFWKHISASLKGVNFSCKKAINELYNNLDTMKNLENKNKSTNKTVEGYILKRHENYEKEMKTTIRMKCNDLLFYIMKHFSVEFNMNKDQIPRQWPDIPPEQIHALYDNLKTKYMNIINQFICFEINLETMEQNSLRNKSKKTAQLSMIQPDNNNDEVILNQKEIQTLKKKVADNIDKEYEQAVKKHKQTYSGAIPTWAWVLAGVVALDDIILWMASPYIAIPVTLILVIIVMIMVFGGKSFSLTLLKTGKQIGSKVISNVSSSAISKMVKKQ